MRFNLPIGLQFVAKHFNEGALFHSGHAFEKAFDWKKL
jgi:Asp-tRNA(Asn)/Glu-tRNA(Gln) amidotransferase A subunit family amidase